LAINETKLKQRFKFDEKEEKRKQLINICKFIASIQYQKIQNLKTQDASSYEEKKDNRTMLEIFSELVNFNI
jgi:hypothetical protein